MIKPARTLPLIVFCLLICTIATSRKKASDEGKDIVKGDLGTKIDSYLTGLTPDRFAGSVLVAKEGEIIINKGYGMAIRSENIPNTSESIIVIGSITKQFTAAGILRLEMQEKLNTEDSIVKYFTEVPAAKEDITLHQLLTHTSGLIDYTGDDWINGDFEVALRDETVQEALDAPLLSKPGEEFHYSNSGYSVLAAIIEIVSGKSYEEYLSEYIFKPAGMNSTGYRLPDWDKHVVAHYCSGEEDFGTFLERPYPYWNLLGNGGILTTTGDMYRWHLALEGEGVLSTTAKEKFYKPFLDNYAYGWSVKQTSNGLLIQHSGGGSFRSSDSAIFRRYMDAQVVVVVLGHQDFEQRSMVGEITSQLAQLVFGRE